MERKRWVFVVLAFFILLTISGCETVPKKVHEEVSGLKTRVETLETRVDSVEARQVESMAGAQAMMAGEAPASLEPAVSTNVMIKARPGKVNERVRDIQACLKNAGFYNGKIDGIKGRQTRRAIKEFQKTHSLRADGIVGPKTWELLSKYESGPSQTGGAETVIK